MIKNKLGIGLLGGWHIHAPDFADKILTYPECEIVTCWDNDTAQRMLYHLTIFKSYCPEDAEILTQMNSNQI